VLLPASLREDLLEQLEQYIDALGEAPTGEAVAGFVVEYLETAAEELDIPDIIGDLEDAGALDGALLEVLGEEIDSADDFVFSAEDVLQVFERLCEVDWDDE